MPVIRAIPQDPTDLVLQGEQLRMSVMDALRLEVGVPGAVMIAPPAAALGSIVQDEDAFWPMNSFICTARLSTRRSKDGRLQQRANAGISTPCGAWVWLDWSPLLNTFQQSTQRWVITGVTRDNAGSPLGNCDVIVMETGRQYVGGLPIVVLTESDGSGNYSVEVPLNTLYQVLAYKPGAPDVAGLSLNTVVPVAM
jgi:hypothetical protein